MQLTDRLDLYVPVTRHRHKSIPTTSTELKLAIGRTANLFGQGKNLQEKIVILIHFARSVPVFHGRQWPVLG